MHWGAERALWTPACGARDGNPRTRLLHTGPVGPPQRAQPQSHEEEEGSPGAAGAEPRGGHGSPRGSLASFPARPKEPSPHRALPKPLLRRVLGGQAHPEPSAADHTSGERSAASASVHPAGVHAANLGTSRGTLGASKHPRGDALLPLRGKVSPLWRGQGVRAAYVIPARPAAGGGRKPSPTVTAQTAVRSRGWLRLARGRALPGGVAALHHAPLWPLAAAGFCHTSHSHPRHADLPHTAAKILIGAGGGTETGCTRSWEQVLAQTVEK